MSVRQTAAANRPAQVTAALRGMRVLLVDDNVETVESFSTLLELEGAEVLCAHDGPAGLALARTHAAGLDLLLSDIGMPGMDGYALIRAVRAIPALAGLPAIALSGFGRDSDGRALEAGFSACLTKPVSMDRLLETVGGLVPESGS